MLFSNKTKKLKSDKKLRKTIVYKSVQSQFYTKTDAKKTTKHLGERSSNLCLFVSISTPPPPTLATTVKGVPSGTLTKSLRREESDTISRGRVIRCVTNTQSNQGDRVRARLERVSRLHNAHIMTELVFTSRTPRNMTFRLPRLYHRIVSMNTS